MKHRHLNHTLLTLAAIDDIVERGGLADWAELRRAAVRDAQVAQRILAVCRPRLADPYAQRYHLWSHYASRRVA